MSAMNPMSAMSARKGLPRNITRFRHKFRVRIARREKHWSRLADTLDEAVAIQAELERQAGPAVPKGSNTGVAGISETIKWVKYRPRYCFQVALPGRAGKKRVYYGRDRSRGKALRLAMAIRQAAVN